MNYSLKTEKELEQKLQSKAHALLKDGSVDYIIGFEQGSLPFTTTPLITKNHDNTSRLVVNSFIVNNLSHFLNEIKGRIGIVVKGCDSRSEITILGISCPGMIDPAKVELLLSKNRDDLRNITREGNNLIVLNDKKEILPITEVLYDNCLGCDSPIPQEHDVLFGETNYLVTDKAASQQKINLLKSLSPEERWQYWKHEFSRCIRCYACRNVCPVCYCEQCFVEETEPRWLSPAPNWQDNLMFQVVRNLHVAGRCTDCGECERSCPVRIPLRNLTREMYDIVVDSFDYEAGKDKNAAPLLSAYEFSEVEGVFR
jgi:ferredoxin